MSLDVPVIDIAAYVADAPVAERAAVAGAVDTACRTVGFMQIVGHGIPPAVVDGLAAAMDDFFAQPFAEKNAYRTPPSINRGYTPPRSESLILSLGLQPADRMKDYFEAFNVGAAQSDYPHAPGLPQPDYAENVWPAVPAFRSRVEAYFDQAQRVARTMTRVFADALGLEPDFFVRRTTHSLDVLRMNNYALPPGTDVTLDGDLVGMGEHTDYGIVTILWADEVPGLQVLGSDGEWHDVQPIPGALLVNLGDVTARWTNEQWQSTLHRVMPPVIEGTIERRRSAAFFHDGDVDALIRTLPQCVDAEHPDLFESITIGEHIAGKLAGSREGVRYDGAAREAARIAECDGAPR